jgi:phage replication-related protein YjqB (UPF0714/DUF867 family)
MSRDSYRGFDELITHEECDKDYRISIRDVGSSVTIIAPHGGRIEPRTSDLAKCIAGDDYNYYCFEGIKSGNNGRLHITSHQFDEPSALKIVSTSDVVVAVHACTGNAGRVYVGGLDNVLKQGIAEELEARGIAVSKGHPRFQGSNPNNICNRGLKKKGVQLEITRDLRDDLGKVEIISDAVRAALGKV